MPYLAGVLAASLAKAVYPAYPKMLTPRSWDLHIFTESFQRGLSCKEDLGIPEFMAQAQVVFETVVLRARAISKQAAKLSTQIRATKMLN